MAKYWDLPIDDSVDWGGDASTGGLPVKGNRVQEYIRNNIVNLKTEIANATKDIGNKFGGVAYSGGKIIFYDEDGGRELANITLSGTSYTVEIESNKSQNFNVLTTDVSTDITLTPKTYAVEIGSSQKVYFPEDYTFTAEVDNGNGYVDITPMDNRIKVGKTGTVNVRNYLKTGANRIRIIVKGDASEQIKSTVYTANLTSLFLTCSHRWENAFVEGNTYEIGNIFFGGNVTKTLHIKIDGREYTQPFAASTQYVSVPYSYKIDFPTHGSKVYPVEIWLSGEDVETQHTKFNIMCVAANDKNAKLVCINDVAKTAYNFATQTLFKFATYNKTQTTLNMDAHINETVIPLVTGLVMNVQTETVTDYTTTLQLDTEEESGISLVIAMDGQIEQIPVDNSNAYIATPGANFYLQPGLKYNTSEDREVITNSATGAGLTPTYDADWSNMTWSDDGWTTDKDGNKALRIMAGSTISIPDLKPLVNTGASSATVEFMYKVENPAVFDKPIFSIMSTETYDKETTRGIVLFPNELQVLSSGEKSITFQKLDVPENKIMHMTIVLQRNYKAIGRNLCRIYINGIENVTFEYAGTSSFIGGTTNDYVRIGQESADVNLYMMRTYPVALEGTAVLTNYLNAMIDTAESQRSGIRNDNAILDSGYISYDLVKKAGFNCMVIETDEPLPSLDNPSTATMRVNMRFEYNDTPEWNVIIKNVPIDGQGTTSMKYKKWNLRNKIKSADTEWYYPNLNGGTTEIGKDGYIAGYGLHPKVSTITSKKNVASSPQGHKMGATGLYDELFALCESKAMLPNTNCRVATYQNPFMGFTMDSNGNYVFVGLYTSGPDKKDKKTFGYNETSNYPALMMLEGPNHSPFMTRFLVPWTDDVVYDYANETLTCGGEEGWDADIVADYSTDKASDAQAIMDLYVSEFKPAYDAIYYTSPYIAPLPKSLDEINADVIAFQTETTDGYSNKLMTFYNNNYELVYYRIKTAKYEVLPLSTHNMLTYLGLSGNPSKSDIRTARANKFKTEVFKYVSLQEALYHESFCEFLGITDNEAKNTYWRKFTSIANNGKWGFNQDDMDTLFQTDNNGQDTKSYSIEPTDVNESNGSEIFQGSSSAFWTQLRNTCSSELRDKMKLIVENLIELAAKYKINAGTINETVKNIISYYFHEHSAKYFPATAYNEDTLFAYINVWAENPDATYNSVPPLTQIHGDHYLTEMNWIEKRIAYMFSKYRLGGFTGSDGDGYGTLEFTPAAPYTMTVEPAIDLYPRVSIGGQDSTGGSRTKRGEDCAIALQSTGDTTVYLKGVDWLSSLGNLKNLVLASRGGSEEIKISISGKRLRDITVGDDDASNVKFNATGISIAGPSIETIDLHNCSTLKGTLDLSTCSRLREIDLSGTNIAQPIAPVGGRVTEYKFPENSTTVFLHSLNLLDDDNITLPNLDKIENLYINGMSSMDVLSVLFSIMNSENNVLKYITLVWNGTLSIETPEDLALFRYLAEHVYDVQTGEGYGAVTYINGQIASAGQKPIMQGHIYVTKAYQEDIDAITNTFPNVSVDGVAYYYKFFEDETLLDVVKRSPKSDGFGILLDTWKTGMSFNDVYTLFVTTPTDEEKANIKICNELGDIESFTKKENKGTWFANYTSLEEVTLPKGEGNFHMVSPFLNCTSLKTVHIDDSTTAFQNGMSNSFKGCTSLENIDIKNLAKYDSTATTLDALFEDCTNLKTFRANIIGNTNNGSIIANTFRNCSNLETVVIQNLKPTQFRGIFSGCTKLTNSGIVFNNADFSKCTTYIELFKNCTNITSIPSWIDFSKTTSTQNMFTNSGITSVGNLSLPLSTSTQNMFLGCTKLSTVGNLSLPKANDIRSMFSTRDGVFEHCGDIYAPLATLVDSLFWYSDIIDVGNITIPSATSGNIFTYCSDLVTVGGLTGLKISQDMQHSRNLSAISVHNIVNTAAGGTEGSAITITLAKEAYDRWAASDYYTPDIATCEEKHIVIVRK